MMQWNKAVFLKQLQLNLVAIISLLTALGGLSYNNWRNHQNELNQNMRIAAFEVLKDLGALQTIVNFAHFEKDASKGSAVEGWGHVVLIRDVSQLLTTEAADQGEALYRVWQAEWQGLDTDASSEANISVQIAETRKIVLDTIAELD